MNDEVRALDRKLSLSNFVGYIISERAFLSEAFVQEDHAEPRTGEPSPRENRTEEPLKPQVER